MTSKEYLTAMAQMNDRIYIDTASVMNADWFQQFAENAETIFLEINKRITIAQAVRSEICRHLESSDLAKRENASKAVMTICQHKDLFDTAGGKLNDEDVAKAFADADLLAELMTNKKDACQLLITNDRALSKDAFELNQLLSCRGYRINVCHITRYGFLQMCDCVKEHIHTESKTLSAQDGKTMHTQISVCDVADSMQKETTTKQSTPAEGFLRKEEKSGIGKNIFAIGSAFSAGVVVGKYGKQIGRTLISFASMLH